MIHKAAEVYTENIGVNTTVWQFCVILKGAVIGENCNINCNVFVEDDVRVGNNVTVKSGVQLWNGIIIEDDVFIGPNVTFTNDLFPRSKNRDFILSKTKVKKGASIGANSTILAGVEIGDYALIGIGSVVTRNVPKHALVYGNPAKIHGWVDFKGNKLNELGAGIYSSINGDKFRMGENGLIKI